MAHRGIQIGIAILLSVGLTSAFFLVRGREAKAVGDEELSEPTTNAGISAMTIHPKADSTFQISVDRPCDVEPYYRSPIEAPIAGEVTSIRVAPGSWVEKGQSLVQIFRPDLQADEREKGNFVKQRETELLLAQAKLAAASVAVKTAKADLEKAKTLLIAAKAVTQYREAVFDRLEQLWQKRAIDKNVRDEGEKNLGVARADEASAIAVRIFAESKVEDAEANVKVMEAEVERARQLIEVARSNHEQAKAELEYANVKAPMRGTVVTRHVDPGAFVQNASTGHPTSLVTMERTDIMTVVMHVPDNYAPFVTPGTEAIIELDALEGIKIHGRVTRLSGSLKTPTRDRTMQVEVDLWNGTQQEYQKMIVGPRNQAATMIASAVGQGGIVPNPLQVGRMTDRMIKASQLDLKEGLLPVLPEFTGPNPLNRSLHLLTDMYGKMTLLLKTFGDTRLIPSQAILRQGGRTSIYVVRDGKAHMIPVEVQVDDGNMAKVVRLSPKNKILGDLNEKEEVIVSNQEELTEGQEINPTLINDWATLEQKKVD